MNTLQDMGVDIYWKNALQGDLVLYKRFFMRSSVIPSFNEAFSSRKLAAIYGTAGEVDEETKRQIVNSIKSFKDFHGGICGILTGGSAGSVMSFVSETTASLGMLSGAVYWKIPGVDIYPHVDFAAYLGRNDLLERQEILSNATEADIYFKGGVGTNLENAITFVKKKFLKHDARRVLRPKGTKEKGMPRGCRCADVLKGKTEPNNCPAFGKACTPEKQIGPCMVSVEGACYNKWLARKYF